jgi:chloramphenicol-sensitive protein RarD
MQRQGIFYAVGAYLMWGLFPLFWKQLEALPALQLIGHRITWSFILLVMVLLLAGRLGDFRAAIDGRRIRIYLAAALLISTNWFAYVWAVTHGFVVESSLGYYINPLFSVLLGVLVYGEKLRPVQWLPIGLAAAGVLYLSFTYGSVPWIALVLAASFGLYGWIKKAAPLGSLYGLTLETGLLFVPAVAFLLWSQFSGSGAFLHSGPLRNGLMVASGLVTIVPLLLFSAAAPRVTLSTLGILQYINPTLQFILGIWVYGEPFSHDRLIGFGIVWSGLALFWIEGMYARRAGAGIPLPELGEG